jgi:hypothetical protein
MLTSGLGTQEEPAAAAEGRSPRGVAASPRRGQKRQRLSPAAAEGNEASCVAPARPGGSRPQAAPAGPEQLKHPRSMSQTGTVHDAMQSMGHSAGDGNRRKSLIFLGCTYASHMSLACLASVLDVEHRYSHDSTPLATAAALDWLHGQ